MDYMMELSGKDVYKRQVFSGVNVSGSEDSDVIYQPVYEVAGLEGAVYVQDNDKKEMVDIICGKFFICYACLLYTSRCV